MLKRDFACTAGFAFAALASAAALTTAVSPAHAAAMVFSGTATNVTLPPQVDASCAPLLRLSVGPADTAGTSNFGGFTYIQTHCSTGMPGPYSGGMFQYSFGSDLLEGSYSGLLSASATPGLFNNVINLVVTGGTGRFLGGSGAITGIGTVDFRITPRRQTLALDGALTLPAVPEPAAWLTMIAGFGLVGGWQRRKRLQLGQQVA